MIPNDAAIDRRFLQRLRAEYLEMPGLRLRATQVQRLCGIESNICNLLLEALVNERFLRINADGTYARASEGQTGPDMATRNRRDSGVEVSH